MTSKYSKVFISKSGSEKYRLWVQKDSQGCLRYGWNRYKFNNWYNESGSGYFSAKERDSEFKSELKNN